MHTNTALFYIFSAVLLFASFRVITARSPVYAALYLVLAFFSAACVWILLRAEFLAISLVLVYVGAAMVLFPGFNLSTAPLPDAAALKLGNTKLLGIEVYTKYLYPLQIAAVLLLVAIIAAIALTLRKRKDTKYLNPAEQLKARKADRLRIVKMKPTIELPAAPPAAPGGDKA